MPPVLERPEIRRPPRRRGLTWLGIVLIVAGLALLGYVGWQFFGTNWVSSRSHAATVEKVEQQWEHAADGSGRVATATEAGPVTGVIRVPRFGSSYAVPIIEGTSDRALAAGVGHVPRSVGPGARGNFALSAHRVTHGEPFRRLPDLVAGDEVLVETRKSSYVYVLDTGGRDLSVPFTQGWVNGDVPRNPRRGGVGPDPDQTHLITLTTCAELFHTDNRLVVFGHLDSVRPRR